MIKNCYFEKSSDLIQISHIIRKLCENKGTDQLRGKRTADQHFFCNIDSILSLFFLNFKPLAISSRCSALFVPELVRNLKDRISNEAAPIITLTEGINDIINAGHIAVVVDDKSIISQLSHLCRVCPNHRQINSFAL